MQSSVQKSKIRSKRIFFVMAAIAVIAGVIAYKLASDHGSSPLNHSSVVTTKGDGRSHTSSSMEKNTATTNSNTTPSTPNTSPSLKLIQPSGTFVSNHYPNLSGSPKPNIESSECITTPGATCYISFTQGNTQLKLPTVKADASGAAQWPSWSLQSIGLTQGTWQVTATAMLNSNTSITTDPVVLQVAP